jgi:hypothetical protein
MIRMSKNGITRLFVGAMVAVAVGLALGIAALLTALASDAIDFGGSHVIDVSGGSGAWTAVAFLIVGSVVVVAGSAAAVVSWVGALVNTWELEEKTWFASLLALGLLGFGIVAMIAYAVAGPDGMQKSRSPVVAPAA